MINWKSLVGEDGIAELKDPFLLVAQRGPTLMPMSADGQNPMVTQFLVCKVKSFDEATGGLVLTYEPPAGPGEAKQACDLHLDEKTVAYFVRASQILRASGLITQ